MLHDKRLRTHPCIKIFLLTGGLRSGTLTSALLIHAFYKNTKCKNESFIIPQYHLQRSARTEIRMCLMRNDWLVMLIMYRSRTKTTNLTNPPTRYLLTSTLTKHFLEHTEVLRMECKHALILIWLSITTQTLSFSPKQLTVSQIIYQKGWFHSNTSIHVTQSIITMNEPNCTSMTLLIHWSCWYKFEFVVYDGAIFKWIKMIFCSQVLNLIKQLIFTSKKFQYL